ncbi:BEN domain-containing protein 3 [Stylophora pistillata]|uniref:BEN domain-containing protein 3 n=1 Tax=Stylophora pistillata TaxID=50429 RepID=A0A2B4RHN7_STYPI|nr:BEN domain-containing protein 3 [Stylophora pistillata]
MEDSTGYGSSEENGKTQQNSALKLIRDPNDCHSNYRTPRKEEDTGSRTEVTSTTQQTWLIWYAERVVFLVPQERRNKIRKNCSPAFFCVFRVKACLRNVVEFGKAEERDRQLEISIKMESYPGNQSDSQAPESGEPQEATENRKEMLHHSSKRKSSPRNHQRNYRRRSFSESPEKSPERSKEQCPVSQRQSRHSDQGGIERVEAEAKAKAEVGALGEEGEVIVQGISDQRVTFDCGYCKQGPEVNGQLATLLWKVEKLLENQERVLKNQEKLVKLMAHQQEAVLPRKLVPSGRNVLNGVRTANHKHSRPEKHIKESAGELQLSASVLGAVAHLKNLALPTTSHTGEVPSLIEKPSRGEKRVQTASSDTKEFNGTTQSDSGSGDGIAGLQSPVLPFYPLNGACVDCDSTNNAENQVELLTDSDQMKELLSWAERIQKTSCSVGNFSVNLVKVLFTKDEILNRNCSGTRGKEALDSDKLNLVRYCAFKLYSIPPEEQDKVWKQRCVISIDEFLRRGNRSRVQKTKSAPVDFSVVVECESDDVKDSNMNESKPL